MWASAKTVGLVVAMVGALLPLGSIGGHNVAAPQTDMNEILMLSLENPSLKATLPSLGMEILVDYGNGLYLARGRTVDLGSLRDIGIDTWEIPNRTILTFPESGYSFDTRAGPPSLPPNLVARDTPEKIVQFIGPIKSEWVAAVESAGAAMEEYFDSYAFTAVMGETQVETIRSFPFVNWIGTYEPAYKVQSGLLEMNGIVPVSVIAHDGVDETRLRTVLEGFGAYVTTTWTMPTTAEARIDATILPAVARLPDVLSISMSSEKKPLDWAAGEIHHFHDAWMPSRSGIPTNLTGHSPGPDGIQGTADDIFETVGIMDSGFDANNANAGWTDLFSGPLGDRVVSIRRRTVQCNQPDGRARGIAHGTVVVGTVLSNGYGWEKQYGENPDDFVWDRSEAGVVPEGLLSFDCVGQGGGIAANPAYWDDEYADGAKTMSNSYGNSNTVYDPTATAVDARIDASNDKMIIFAAGNGGPEPHTVTGMALGKNGLAVGATENFRPDRPLADDPNIVPDFSSRGTPGDRVKPDLVTVSTAVVTGLGYGEWLYNADPGGQGVPQSDYIIGVDQYDYRVQGVGSDGIPDYRYYTGTSVSAPHAAGLYMLTREYFREMYGIDNVNSQLAKAMLINGAVRMDPALYEYPGIEQGWGRIDLEQSLFPPAPRSNQWEEGLFTTTGTWNPSTINTNVISPDVPLKVTLVWIDSPAIGGVLVRNLDLRVRNPSGTIEYHGNQYAKSGPLKGYTDPTAAGYDGINNVEQVEVHDPAPGMWSVEVRGTSIPSTAKFALIFSADVGPRREYQVDLSTDHTTTLEVAPGGTANLPFTVMNFGNNFDLIEILDDAPVDITVSYDWIIASFAPGESKDNLAMFAVAQTAVPGVRSIRICGRSESDPALPPASDCISVQIVIVTALPPRYDVTSGGGNEMEPSVLTFTKGGMNHVFVAYKKTTPLNYSDLARGGVNVWVAHNTVDDNHVPNGTWTQQCVSDWNEEPNDLRMLRIDNGAFEGRIVITWSGKDPLETNPDSRPWSRIAFSDPPYTDWTLKTIQKNYGSSVYNAVRVGFPLFRSSVGPNGTLVYIWEHLDSVSSDILTIIAVQTHATFSSDGGNTWGDCFATPGQCYKIAPNFTPIFYFFPGGVVDQNDVLWVFFHWRAATTNVRKLAVVLWDGLTWDTGWTFPINIWGAGGTVNLRYPAAVSTAEGGNRVYVAVTSDEGGTDELIFVLYAEGTYGSGIVGPQPAGAPLPGLSPDFSQPQGPMGFSVLSARYDSGPVLNAVHTDDGLTWLPYIESMRVLGGMTKLLTWFSPNGFTDRQRLDMTGDAYAKGHQMSDTLTTPVKSCVYEVWHESRERFERASYNIRLAVYCDGWQAGSDTTGPLTKNPATIPNPYDKTYSKSLRVVAEISDCTTGFSNITAAELTLTATSVSDPLSVDWSNAWQMNLTGYNRSPVETAWLWANDTAAGWPLGSCHRFWIRGEDEKGNWGSGGYVDVCVTATDVYPLPPTMTAARLSGTGHEDVEIVWSKSSSDGSGSGIVTSYKVSRATSPHGPFVVVANVTATGTASYSWTDAGAGHGDTRNFFYNAVASSLAHDSGPSRLAGKFTRTMTGGKQLVSFPLEQADDDPSVIFQTFSYIYARTYVTGTPNPWWCHKPGLFVNSLTELEVTQGYWVELDGPGTMTVAGLVPQGVVMHLKSGWNMIGFPSFYQSYTFAGFNAAVSGMLQLVEIYDASEGPYYLQRVHRNAWASTYLTPGFAYMIRVSSDVDLAVPSY